MELITSDNLLAEKVVNELVNCENEIKRLKSIQDDYKAKLVEICREKGIKKIDNEFLTLTYVAPTTRESFDSKKFRESYPEIYDDFVKISEVKDSVRVKIK